MGKCALFTGLLIAAFVAAPGWAARQANSTAAAQAAHTVVLLAFDGFRWDYATREDAANLLALGKRGVWAPKGMLPSYPALNAPNLFTIVTGLYPGHHGIVGDTFFDPVRNARFSADDARASDASHDGFWYSGTPLWSLAESQGVRTACVGWLGCAAQIAGHRPTYLGRADLKSGARDGDRERQILDWLRLPVSDRPRFIAVRFTELGQAARRFGPDAPQTRAAVCAADALIGRLTAGLTHTGLPIDLVIVSDHGFAQRDGGWIALDQFADLSGWTSAGTFLYGKNEADREHVYNQLKKATSEFVAYRLKNLPADLHLKPDERAGDPVVIATGPYAIRVHAPPANGTGVAPRAVNGSGPSNFGPNPFGIDGFDPRIVPQMKAIFFAAGPDIVEGKTVAPFENVHLYPWLAHLLGLNPAKSDGNLNILSGTLRDGGGETEQ